ncbi:hypothetical protein L228DRAFT_241260 [Xylona heveae TC161]|uniref:Uncharacterized protein n=1 Tax=Xylona heveae (strain CBS 132557 / TC161) TaxID=1328760 RepID=A0A165A7N6_XYLHT|nr:hypothetical protein L228DRAFT_241260 [Xylona heveae TC161]KZF20070.1 hypothetical protein L228DRAFT_241260 [Xylona heveae TC161]
MALRQPTRAPLRHVPVSTAPQPTESAAIAPDPQQQRLLDTQEWVVFSPSLAPSERTATVLSDQTHPTGVHSRLSDFGSLGATAQSEEGIENDISSVAVESEVGGAIGELEDEQDADDLDSLDDGLHDFREPSVYRSPSHRLGDGGDTVLPTHDGLGMFPASGPAVQAQLWRFEQSNTNAPFARQRRASSVQRRLDAAEEESEAAARIKEKTERIERWRLEQSMALLEEIEKETRRRRRRRLSRASEGQQRVPSASLAAEESDMLETDDLHADLGDARDDSEDSSEEESLWQRITRHFLRDLMRIDENILSVIFGEELPAEARESDSSSADIHTEMQKILQEEGPASESSALWEERLLARIARELGLLVHQLSDHPGAFSTYLRTHQAPSYAGLTQDAEYQDQHQESSIPASQASVATLEPAASSTKDPQFTPTLQQQPQPPHTSYASRWGIDDDDYESLLDHRSTSELMVDENENEAHQLQQEREYWERDLDIKMVFSFLRNRFSKSPRPASAAGEQPPLDSSVPTARRSGRPTFTSPPMNPSATASNPRSRPPFRGAASSSSPPNAHVSSAAARRAAMIRQQHPLVSLRNAQHHHHHHHHLHHSEASLAGLRRSVATSRLPLSHHQLKRRGSGSCASQSTKASRTAKSGSSRNYWDLGGSVGSGSLTTGGLGAWGEV